MTVPEAQDSSSRIGSTKTSKHGTAVLERRTSVRPIDADAFLKDILTAGIGKTIIEYSESDIGYMIRKRPTIDAVEVLRCRECKYWGDEDGKLQCSDGVLFARCKVHNYLIDGRHTGWCPTENDFCSYGERKEGAD